MILIYTERNNFNISTSKVFSKEENVLSWNSPYSYVNQKQKKFLLMLRLLSQTWALCLGVEWHHQHHYLLINPFHLETLLLNADNCILANQATSIARFNYRSPFRMLTKNYYHASLTHHVQLRHHNLWLRNSAYVVESSLWNTFTTNNGDWI